MTTARFDEQLFRHGLQAASAHAVYDAVPAPAPRTLWQILEATAGLSQAAAIDDGRSN